MHFDSRSYGTTIVCPLSLEHGAPKEHLVVGVEPTKVQVIAGAWLEIAYELCASGPNDILCSAMNLPLG